MLLSGLFVLDFLVIHPFEDGNGRVARLLTGALLGERGYTVGRYVSLEQAVAESADTYYHALLDSTHGWHEDTADPLPWLSYFTSVIAGACAVFADRAAAAHSLLEQLRKEGSVRADGTGRSATWTRTNTALFE